MTYKGFLLVSSLVICVIGSAYGEGLIGTNELDQSYKAAFQEMYEDPSDLDKATNFVKLAIAIGDLEGAIAALERMLIFEPDLPQVRMELGLLYFRLESLDQASVYLRSVLEEESLPEDIRNEVEVALKAIRERTSVHTVTGRASVISRYQSNANSGPDNGQILLFGKPAILESKNISQADSDFSAKVEFGYIFDFQKDSGHTLNIDFSAQSNWYSERTELDASLFDFRVGPKLYPKYGKDKKLEVHPYLFVNRYQSDQDTIISGGGGLAFSHTINDDISMSLQGEYQVKKYDIQPSLDAISAMTTLGSRIRVGRQTYASLSGLLKHVNTETIHEDYDEYGIGFMLEHAFSNWQTGISVAPSWKRHKQPNASIDPGQTRREQSTQGTLMLGAPLTPKLGLNLSVGVNAVNSNIANYEYDNYFASFSVYSDF
jgi:tetratricopeptide (TPR) repeat protein